MKIVRLGILLGAVLVAFLDARHIVLMSAPGSGKGTLSNYLVEMYGYEHICAGDMFRKEIAQGSALGRQIEAVVNRGDYVDEAITCALIEQRLVQALSEGKKIVIDGFPRIKTSLEFLHDLFVKYGIAEDVVFVQLSAPDDVCLTRACDRMVCVACSAVYNAQGYLPSRDMICDRCGESIIKRAGDTMEIMTKRLRFFHEAIEPLLAVAAQWYPIVVIDVCDSREALEEQYEALVV